MNSELRTFSSGAASQRSNGWEPSRTALHQIGRVCLAVALLVAMLALGQSALAASGGKVKFQRIPTQFIAALADPGATSGGGAQSWGLWPLDPGPRGVKLDRYDQLKGAGGVAPARWRFNAADWWLEEHGLIMEQPVFPVPARKYVSRVAAT